METLNKITNLMESCNCDNKKLASVLGLNRQVVTDWKAGRSQSYKKYLPQIASFFNVSVDYLLNNENSKEKASPASSETLKEYVVFHRDGKNVKVKFTPEQQKIFDALVASTKIEDADN